MKKVGIIIASVREGRVGESIAKHVLKLAQTSKAVEYSLIDLKEVNLPMLSEPYPAAMANYQYPHTKAWSKTVSSLDGFIIVTAEYNHGYPPAIKNALDHLYKEWNNKSLAFVGYGYSSGVRAIEQLRQVVSYLQLKPLWKDVGISLVTNLKDGAFVTSEAVDTQLNGLIKDLESTLAG
jgi:NAD(P)H-dependent FMN reductase